MLTTYAAIFIASFVDPVKFLPAMLTAWWVRRLPTKLLLGLLLGAAMEGVGVGLHVTAEYGDSFLLNWLVCTIHVFIVSSLGSWFRTKSA